MEFYTRSTGTKLAHYSRSPAPRTRLRPANGRRKVTPTTMPLYEYRCTSCKKGVTILTLRASEAVEAVCDKCGGHTLERLMSRFALGRSDEARMEALSDPSSLAGLDEKDPASVARWMKRMSREMGDEVGGGGEIDQMAEEMASGNLDDADGGNGSEDADA